MSEKNLLPTEDAQPAPDLKKAVDLANATTERWIENSTNYSDGPTAKLLADVLKDPGGLSFTVEFVDGVIRPEDPEVAARNLARLTKDAPGFLPAWLRYPAVLGGKAGSMAPNVVVPMARRVFSEMVGDLVVEVSGNKLDKAIARLKKEGARLNLNLLGEAVLGDEEAERRLEETFKLLRRDDVDYVSLKASSVLGPHSDWAHEEQVEEAYQRLLPLYLYAASAPEPKFINLDMEVYKDLHITLDLFHRLLETPQLNDLEMGIVIQAYLPDSLEATKQLDQWAKERRERGGAPIKIRLVKGANLAMERVESEMNDWPLVTWDTKQATDANYMRILDYMLEPDRMDYMKVGVAGHNLFSLAYAWELAGIRGVRDAVDLEMLSGMASSQAQAIETETGPMLYYVPVVRKEEFDVAISYLVRRLEENSDPQNFMASIFDLASSPQVLDKERQRFFAAHDQMLEEGDSRCHPNRTQNRLTETWEEIEAGMKDEDGNWIFRNTPNSDPSLPANQEWARAIAERIPESQLGVETVEAARVSTEEELNEVIEKALKAGEKWKALSAEERADALHKVGVQMDLRRADLIEVAASELGKTVDQTDVEVSEAVDFAHYYAELGKALDDIPGAEFTPGNLTVVTPPWNFPVAIPLGGVMSALAAGTPVIFKPAGVAKRTGALLAEAMVEAGMDPDLAPLVVLDDRELGQQLITDPRVDNVTLTGGSETAEMFLGWRPDLKLLAETSGKNAIIVTPSADLDLAVDDIVKSAFGHAGQKCSAASLVILVGSVADSERVHRQLLDSVRSLEVDWPDDLMAEMSPLSTKPGAKLMQGFTELDAGQTWAIKPIKLDYTDRLWGPGVRDHVKMGDRYHQVEYFGPITGIMRADTLEEAVEMQNGTDFGLTAGIHSLDTDEINYWLDNVQAGNVYVNRGITGAIVQRQPFGGWKLSQVGPGTKAGGPNYLYGFGTLTPKPGDAVDTPVTKPALKNVVTLAKKVLDEDGVTQVEEAAANAQHAAQTHFDLLNDPSDLRPERNVLRYVPAEATIRVEEGVPLADVLTVATQAVAVGDFKMGVTAMEDVKRFGAGHVVGPEEGAVITLSVAEELPAEVVDWARRHGIKYKVETPKQFQGRIARADVDFDGRVRHLGADEESAILNSTTAVSVWDGPATTAARVEILPFVHEQAVSMTMHRFGTPSAVVDGVLPGASV